MFNEKVNELQITMKAKDAAKYIGISYWLILEMAKRHEIPYISCGRKKLFRKESLDKWMEEKEKASTAVEDRDNSYGTLRKIY
ncbi:excisionase family DNA-binding protein [Clostridium sp. WILCCON 0269]|uniref:Excisionase family DNA-binding protein n=1 Tax=Candidatus Clostridium eludens TaxID=3381663 RepID=A0ABW8SM05_9CLOT